MAARVSPDGVGVLGVLVANPFDYPRMLKDYFPMKSRVPEINLGRWPYGLEVRASRNGLLLQPRRKARADWAKRFRHAAIPADELVSIRQVTNEFDAKEWKW